MKNVFEQLLESHKQEEKVFLTVDQTLNTLWVLY